MCGFEFECLSGFRANKYKVDFIIDLAFLPLSVKKHSRLENDYLHKFLFLHKEKPLKEVN